MSLVQAGSSSAQNPGQGQVQILRKALQHFQNQLLESERAEIKGEDIVPDAHAAIAFTAELDRNPARTGASIASRLHNVLQSVHEFTTVVDTFVSSNPEIAALVWGSIKFTMKLVMNYTSHFEQLSQLFMRLTNFCPRVAEYQTLFPNSQQLQKALCEFYASIVAICEHMIQYVQRSGIQKALDVLWSFEVEFKPDEEMIKQRGEDVRIAVEYAKMKSDEREKALQQVEREKQSRTRQLLKTSMRSTSNNLDAIRDYQANREVQRSRKRKRTLIESLTSYSHITAYKDASKKRHIGTAEWIFKSPEFLQWTDATNPRVLFCTGKIGSGKTVLAANVVARQLALQRRAEDGFAFFFIRHDAPESRKSDVIVRSIVKQCLRHDTLTEELSNHLERLCSDPTPSLDDIFNMVQIQQLSDHCRSFTILIDGLNELDIDERRRLLKSMASLYASISYLKIFLSGQESLSAELYQTFPDTVSLSMRNAQAEADIASFVHASLPERHRNGDLLVWDTGLLQEITNVLTTHADGMFLWVTFLMDDVCTHQTDKGIRRALRNLPKSLEETFDRALTRIIKNNKADIAHLVFQWTAVARRNLSTKELREAVSLEVGQVYLSGEDLVNGIKNVALWCENLIQIDEELGLVRFSHFSIAEYITNRRAARSLSRFHFDLDEVDHYAGEICVTYLSMSNFTTAIAEQSRPTPPILLPDPMAIARETATQSKLSRLQNAFPKFLSSNKDMGPHAVMSTESSGLVGRMHDEVSTLQLCYPFLDYAKEHWISHTSKFSEVKSKTWKAWRAITIKNDRPAQIPWDTESSGGLSKPQWAYDNSHYALMSLCLADGEVSGDELKDWVSEAAIREESRLSACRIPEELHLRSGTSKHALIWAAYGGKLDVIDSLLNANADIDEFSVELGGATPLSMASVTGNLELIKYLLARKAAVNAYDGLALRAASTIDVYRMFEQLSRKEGYLDALFFPEHYMVENSSFEDWMSTSTVASALEKTLRRPHRKVIKYLVCLGADVNAGSEKSSGTALTKAAQIGDLKTLEFLLRSGAGVNAGEETWHGMTALYKACRFGQLQVVERLLREPSISIDALCPGYGTALCGAATGGHLKIVQKLIGAGANVNAWTRGLDPLEDLAPLRVASTLGHVEIVDHLLKAGARAQPGASQSPLCQAAAGGYLSIVKRLLAFDDEKAFDRPCETPFHAATVGGQSEIVRYLVDVRADSGAQKRSDQTLSQTSASIKIYVELSVECTISFQLGENLGSFLHIGAAGNKPLDEAGSDVQNS